MLAFDYGLKHIGVAVGQPFTGTASPLTTVRARDGAPDWPAIDVLIAEWQPVRLVVGLPLNMDGTEGSMAQEVRRFGAQLSADLTLPVLYEDERLSTDAAESLLQEAGLRPSDRRRKRDSLAAALILRGFLERGGNGD